MLGRRPPVQWSPLKLAPTSTLRQDRVRFVFMRSATYRVGGWPRESCTLHMVENRVDLRVARKWVDGLGAEYLGIDCESNARDPFEIGYATRLVQVASEDESWVIPVDLNPWELSDMVRDHPRWVAHYAEADERFLCRGLPGEPVRWSDVDPHLSDTQTVLAIYDPRTVTTFNKKERIHPRIPRLKGLKPNVTRLLTPTLGHAEDALNTRFKELAPVGHRSAKAMRTWGFANIPINDPAYQLYAALDPLCTIRLFNLMRVALEQRGQWGRTLAALREQWMVDRGTFQGMQVDGPYVAWLDEQLAAVINGHVPTLERHGIKPSGQGQSIGQAFHALGVPTSPKTDEHGKESWDKEALIALLGICEDVYNDPQYAVVGVPDQVVKVRELAEAVRDVRKAGKYRSNWVAPMLWTIANADGAMHPSMRANGTVTTRMTAQKSATAGPLHSAPKHDTRLRAGVRAERGWVLLSADFSQAEPFVMAASSGDKDFLADLLAGDINSVLATQVYGPAYVKADGKTGGTASYMMRQRCKFAFLAWCYGAGDRKVDTLLGVHTAVTDGWRARWPVFAAHRDAMNQQTVITLASGHRVPLWDRYWVDDLGEMHLRTDQSGRPVPSRLGLNAETQGTQADLLKLSMHRLAAWGWAWALRFELHDELLLCVPAWMADSAAVMLKEAMTVRYRGVVINCEVSIEGRTWQPQPTEFSAADIVEVDDDE